MRILWHLKQLSIFEAFTDKKLKIINHMKKLACALFILMASTTLYAQEQSKPASSQTQPTQTQEPVKAAPATTTGTAKKEPTVTHKVAIKSYCCPSCDYCTTKPGACPNDKKSLIREGMYYCADGTASKEPGKCADGKDMIKMVDRNKKPDDTKKTAPVTPAK